MYLCSKLIGTTIIGHLTYYLIPLIRFRNNRSVPPPRARRNPLIDGETRQQKNDERVKEAEKPGQNGLGCRESEC
jgi:hypothetical protein